MINVACFKNIFKTSSTSIKWLGSLIILIVLATVTFGDDANHLDKPSSDFEVKSLAINLHYPNILYAGVFNSKYLDGLYKSVDGGAHWTYCGFGISGNVYQIHFDPNDKSSVYVGTSNNIYRSTNEGRTWYEFGNTGFKAFNIFFQPTEPSSVIYLSTSSGLFVSTVEHTWKKVDVTFPSVSLYPVGTDPSNPDVVYLIMTKPNDVIIYIVDDAGTPYEWNEYGIYKSNNHGKTLEKVSSIKSDILLISPNNKNVMYGANGKKVLQSIDGGVSWKEKEISIIESSIVDLAINPVNNNVLYATTSYYREFGQFVRKPEFSLSRIFKSTDGGETWQKISDFPAIKIVIDPSNPNILYAGTPQMGIYKSTDAGKTWEAINNGIE